MVLVSLQHAHGSRTQPARPSASTGQKEVLLSSLVPLSWLQLAEGTNGFKESVGFLVEFGVFLHWCMVELPTI